VRVRSAAWLAVACAVAVAAAAATAGCSQGESGAQGEGGRESTPVRIGAIFDLTGRTAWADAAALDGARLAVDRINTRGGLLGRRVELLEREGDADPNAAARAARELADLGVAAVVGLSSDADTAAAAAAAAAHGVPFVGSGASDPRLVAEREGWLFLTATPDNVLAAAAAAFARQRLAARRAAIVVATADEPSRRLARYFGRSFREQGGRVVATVPYRAAASLAEKLEQAPPGWAQADLVYVACPRREARDALAAVLAAGGDAPVMGPEALRAAAPGKRAARLRRPVYFTAQTLLDLVPVDPQLALFGERYHAAYDHTPPNAYACLGYDAVMEVAAAVRSAGSAEPAKVQAALATMRGFEGVSGVIQYGRDGLPRRPVVVARLGNPSRALSYGVPDHVPAP